MHDLCCEHVDCKITANVLALQNGEHPADNRILEELSKLGRALSENRAEIEAELRLQREQVCT